eukprot:a1163_81.p1 GENE.a1163_81~~a1163_81.p1  ORF type:complete len:636 (+),score=230.26 a1163_81:34-1908(+)
MSSMSASGGASAHASRKTMKSNDLVFDRKKLSPEVVALLDKFDADKDGDIDINELMQALMDLHHTNLHVRRLLVTLAVGAVLFALALASIFAVSVGAATLIKEHKIKGGNSGAAVMSVKSGSSDPVFSTVRTGSVDPTVPVTGEEVDSSLAARAARHEERQAIRAAVERGEVVSEEQLRAADEDDVSKVSHACEHVPSVHSSTHSFEVAVSMPINDAIAQALVSTQLPLALAFNNDHTGTSTVVRLLARSNGAYEPATTGLSANILFADFELENDATALARVCCVASTCVYAPGRTLDGNFLPSSFTTNGTFSDTGAKAAIAARTEAHFHALSTRGIVAEYTAASCPGFCKSPSFAAAGPATLTDFRLVSAGSEQLFQTNVFSVPFVAPDSDVLFYCPVVNPVVLNAVTQQPAEPSPNAHVLAAVSALTALPPLLREELLEALPKATASCPAGHSVTFAHYQLPTITVVDGDQGRLQINLAQFGGGGIPIASCSCEQDLPPNVVPGTEVTPADLDAHHESLIRTHGESARALSLREVYESLVGVRGVKPTAPKFCRTPAGLLTKLCCVARKTIKIGRIPITGTKAVVCVQAKNKAPKPAAKKRKPTKKTAKIARRSKTKRTCPV